MLRSHPELVDRRPPNRHLTAVAEGLEPGRALDAGCGHGSETLWLAAHGWRVTAVDFAAAAIARGRERAASLGRETAGRIVWLEQDLGTWAPPPESFDLVLSLYVHVDGPTEELVARLASAVAPGGSLLLVGHLPIDATTGMDTPAAGQNQVTVDAARQVLDARSWQLVVAEERPRPVTGEGADAVVHARRS